LTKGLVNAYRLNLNNGLILRYWRNTKNQQNHLIMRLSSKIKTCRKKVIKFLKNHSIWRA